MKRFLGTGLFAVVSIMLMVGMAFAGTTVVHNGGAAGGVITAGLETLGTARNVTLTSTTVAANDYGAVRYTLTQNLTTTNLLAVSFPEGLAFQAGVVNVCANSTGAGVTAAGNIGSGLMTEGSTSYNFQIDLTGGTTPMVLPGDVIWLASGNCNAGAANDLPIQITTGAAAAGNKLVAVAVNTSGGINVDPSSSAAAVTVQPEFSGLVTTRNMVIDYLGPDSTDGTLFVAVGGMNDVAANVLGLNLVGAAVNYSATHAAAGAGNAGLTVAGLINFDAGTNWEAVDEVWATAAVTGCGTGSGNAQSNVITSPTGAQTLTLTSAAFNGGAAGNTPVGICLGVDGATSLVSRAITGAYDFSVTGAGAIDPTAVTGTFQNWAPNGWQGYQPHMRFSDTQLTFVRIVNANATSGIVFADCRLPDGTVVARTQLGTIAAGETQTYSASAIAAACGITTVNNYAVLLTATVDGDNVFANAYFNLLSAGVWTTRDASLYEANKGVNYNYK